MEHIQISLAAARVNAGMTQEDACKLLHVAKATLYNWEKGVTSPSISMARKISEIYGIPLDNIFLPDTSNNIESKDAV